jgi:glutamyl-tRNA synthetase
MNKPIKTRFAPSPTGYLHVGGLRTALYAYLFAKKNEGAFILRIEDTDRNRLVEDAAENFMKMLKTFGMDWDEGPYYQSQRTELYQKHAKILLESGKAYRCYCTPERLTEMRESQQARKMSPKYDRHCHRLSVKEQEDLYNAGKAFVVRQLIPDERINFFDHIRGDLSFHGNDVDDQVLVKSDGYPTYHLANVVDDHEMGITHVIRGEEWVPSTPKHVWLYKAFGWDYPEFAHLPLLLNADKSKLSKRQGDVATEAYLEKGYLIEALTNFIAFLGWNPGTEQEIFSLAELEQAFSLDRVQKAGAVFSMDKLNWLNGQYIRKMNTQDLALKLLPLLQGEKWFAKTVYTKLTAEDIQEGTSEECNSLLKFIGCVQTRMKTLLDGPEMLRPFLLDELTYKLSSFEHHKMKVDRAGSILALENSIPVIENIKDLSNIDEVKPAMITMIKSLGLKNGQVMWPLRVALTNEEYSPGAFELMEIMGKEMSIKRIKSALAQLEEGMGLS